MRHFVVHLQVPGKVDHAVYVDGSRGLVLDNGEGYELHLNVESFGIRSAVN